MLDHASKIRIDRASFRPPHRPGLRQRWQGLHNSVVMSLRVRQREGSHRQKSGERAHAVLRLQAGRSQRCCTSRFSTRSVWVCGQIARHERRPALRYLDTYERPLWQQEQSGLSKLRRPWNSPVRRMAGQFRGLLSRYVANMAVRFDDRPDRYERTLFARELSLAANVRAMENASLARAQARGWQSKQAISQEQAAA